jgi:hypothetical protein
MRARLTVLSVLVLGTCLSGPVLAQPAGAPPIDPRQMSGIARADAQTEPGTITFRCLLGSFKEPAAGVAVTLELRSADGGKLETRTAVAGDDGRASFGDLAPYYGGSAVASVDFGGEVVKSQAVVPAPTVGFRVLLVKGAGEAGASAPVSAPSTGPGAPKPGDVPMPGTAFPNPNTPKGTVLIGTLDLAAGTAVQGARVRLSITRPDQPVETRDATSDARGTARFDMSGVPDDAVLVAEADLPHGTERSQPFTLAGQTTGVAVVLAKIVPRARERAPLPPPRAVPTLPPGTVRITVVGPDDTPIEGVPVSVFKRDETNTKQRFDDTTAEDGTARITEIPVGTTGLYHVVAEHGGAPWRTDFFQMDDRMGVAATLRVFPITRDVSRVRAAVQFGVEPLENDLARIAQLCQVFVEGDAAYWPGSSTRLEAAEGGTGMVIMNRADMLLDHDGEAPFATIGGPLPPGEVIDLSIAYLLEHDGTAEIRWKSPFQIMEARAVVAPGLKVERGAKSGPVKPQHGGVADDFEVYDLGDMSPGQPFDVAVSGLVTRPRVYQRLGVAIGLAVLLGCGLAFALRPRASLRDRLVRRRDVLLRKLDATADPRERSALIAALDQIFHQLDALGGGPRHADLGAAWSPQDKR